MLVEGLQCLAQVQPLMDWPLSVSEAVDNVTAAFYSPAIWICRGYNAWRIPVNASPSCDLADINTVIYNLAGSVGR